MDRCRFIHLYAKRESCFINKSLTNLVQNVIIDLRIRLAWDLYNIQKPYCQIWCLMPKSRLNHKQCHHPKHHEHDRFSHCHFCFVWDKYLRSLSECKLICRSDKKWWNVDYLMQLKERIVWAAKYFYLIQNLFISALNSATAKNIVHLCEPSAKIQRYFMNSMEFSQTLQLDRLTDIRVGRHIFVNQETSRLKLWLVRIIIMRMSCRNSLDSSYQTQS